MICFHAQQAAEKYLKAFLVFRGVRPDRTHDLRALLAKCVDLEAELLPLDADCRNLNDYAVDVRYPDVTDEVDEEIGRQAVTAAERICVAIRGHLPPFPSQPP